LLDNARRNRLGSLPRHDKDPDAERAIDRSPAISSQVEHNKHICREDGAADGAQFASVPDGFRHNRKKNTETLLNEMELRPRFLSRERTHDMPSLRAGQDQSVATTFPRLNW